MINISTEKLKLDDYIYTRVVNEWSLGEVMIKWYIDAGGDTGIIKIESSRKVLDLEQSYYLKEFEVV